MCASHHSPFRIFLTLVTLAVLAGCTQASVLRNKEPDAKPSEHVRVLLMPLEIELAELTAGGLVAPRADWTEQATRNIIEALRAELQAKNAELILYQPPQDPQQRYRHEQFIKLHNAVREAIVYHRNRDNGFRLTTKDRDDLDWTLGADAKLLREEFGADYALFLAVQDLYASGGRKALSIMLSVLYLFPILPGVGQYGAASLVDLHDGELEWFNRFVSHTGDLRSPDAVRTSLENILKDLPL